MSKGRIFQVIAVVALLLLANLYIRKYENRFVSAASKKPSIDTNQIMQFVSDSINKRCPTFIDSLTELRSTLVQSGRVIKYFYWTDFDTAKYDMPIVKEQVYNVMLNAIKSQPGLKMFRDFQATFIYNYSNLKGNYLFEFTFPPKVYNESN